MGGILMSFKNQLLQIKSLVDQKRLHLLLLMISLYKICDDNNNLMERCPNKVTRVGFCVTAIFA